jgi:hypothetical protein
MKQQESSALSTVGSAFEDAFGAMPAPEKYNAVMLSLLSKGGGTNQAIELVNEMSTKRLLLNADALKALMDTAVGSGTADPILSVLVAAKKNGATRAFATPQLRLPGKPSDSALANLPEVPDDDRATEIGAATALLAAIGGVLTFQLFDFIDFLNLFGSASALPPPQWIIGALAASWAVDRYANSGTAFGVFERGLTRLLQRDLQRECAVESASFLAGYLLGLPCCPFTPTVYKPLEMLTQSSEQLAGDLGARDARLIDRILIWLLAPAALEVSAYKDMLQSEPSLALKFLEAARRREASTGVDPTQGGWQAEQDELRVRWAFSEARRLLQRYSGVREALQEQMAAGVSAGECVVLIEERLKNTWANI